MGLTGSKATLVSRLTVVAVGLVLVSGLSLLLCPEDGPTPAPGLSEVELAADMVPAPSLRSPDLEPADDVIHANAEQGDAASGSDLTQSVAWENSPQRNVRRGVWLEGTIEIE